MRAIHVYMMYKRFQVIFIYLLLLSAHTSLFSQEGRTQYPPGLKNAYFGVNIGYINYPFSMSQLEPGFTADGVTIPHAAVRIVLYGCPINKYLSARITYMRPVNWVQYRNINGDHYNHSVWMNIAGLTLQGHLPLGNKFSLTGEAGLAVITRNGFSINDIPVVRHANYGTGMFGGAIQYHINKKWDLQLSTVWSPEHQKTRQPHTLFMAGGFNYTLRTLPAETVKKHATNGNFFPRQQLIAGYSSNAIGYGVNTAVSKGPVPIFWGGDAQVKSGISLSYQRNIFHTWKVFAMDWAVHTGFWKSRIGNESLFTFSLNPVLRFHAIRGKKTDFFFEYSVAGPTYISKVNLDQVELGRKFTFHDFMGMGIYTGKDKKLLAGLRIAHYSNGNLFPQNDGVMIPLTLNLGYVLN